MGLSTENPSVVSDDARDDRCAWFHFVHLVVVVVAVPIKPIARLHSNICDISVYHGKALLQAQFCTKYLALSLLQTQLSGSHLLHQKRRGNVLRYNSAGRTMFLVPFLPQTPVQQIEKQLMYSIYAEG